MLRTIHLALLAFLAIGLFTPTDPANARAGEWKLVGSEAISLRDDTATISIGRDQGLLSAIQLRAWGKSFYLRTMTVVFGNGQRQVISVYDAIEAGAGSRSFNLNGNRRFVREIRLRYRESGSRGYRRSLVEVFGKEAARRTPPPRPSGNWDRIGSEDLSTRTTRVNIRVRGGGRQLALRVSDYALYIKRVRITFGNGDVQVVNVGAVVEDGEQVGPIDLEGNYRGVTSVRVDLRRQSRRRSARLEVFTQGERGRPAPVPVPRGWKSVAIDDVDLRDDRFTLSVGRNKGLLKSIRIRTRDNAVRIRRVRIVFGNGSVQRVRLNERLRAGGQTDVIDLNGNNRFIREVTVRTQGQNRRRRTRLEVIGKVGQRAVPQLPPISRGWRALDRQTVNLRDNRFIMRIGVDEGGFTALQLRNKDIAVFVRDIRIVFGDGSVQTVRVNASLPAGGFTGVIDLEGRTRFIRQVVIRTRGQGRRGRTELEIIGRVGRAAPARPPASSGGWKTVGKSLFRLKYKSVTLKVGRAAGKLSAIRFKTTGRTATIRAVVIVFDNGEEQTVRYATRVQPSALSRPIKFAGRRGRYVRHVFVRLKRKVFSNRRGTLFVLAKAANGGQWVSLGKRRADMFQPIRETFVVGRNRGRFVRIKLRSHRRHVRIYSVTVTFGNGQTVQLPFSGGLRGNSETRTVNLDRRGRSRFVQSVQVLHKSKISFKGEGATEVLLQN